MKVSFKDLFYLAVIVGAFIFGLTIKRPQQLPNLPINQVPVVDDTALTIKPVDTSRPKIVERIVYLPSKPIVIVRNVGGVDSFLIESPRGITEVQKKGSSLTVKGYFQDTVAVATYSLRHENFRVRLSYDRFLVDQARVKVDKFLGIRMLYPDYSLGIYGGLLFNDRFGVNIEANTKGVGIGLIYFIK